MRWKVVVGRGLGWKRLGLEISDPVAFNFY